MIVELKTVQTMVAEKTVRLQEAGRYCGVALWRGIKWLIPILRLLAFPCFLGLAVTVISLSSGVQLAVALLLLTVVGVAFCTLGAGIQGREWALTTSLFVIAFTIDATFRRRADMASAGMDAQTVAKLVLWGGGLLMGAFNWTTFRRALAKSQPLCWFLAFAVWSLLSTIWSITPAYTFGGGFGMVALIFFVAVTIEGSGLEKITIPLIWACGALTTSALALYAVAPSMAVAMLENGTTPRLAGLTGSPNNLGRTAAVALFFIFFAVRNKQVKAFRADIVVIALSALACLYLSWSRTSLVAVVASIAIVLLRRRLMLIISGAVAGGTALLLLLLANVNWDHLVRLVSRKGSVEELTTLTGRTAIWHYVWDSFLKEPILGYGYGSTKLLIPLGFRTIYGWTTTSSHNMFLQAFATTGVVGGIVIVVTVVLQMRDFVKRPHDMMDALFVFVLISGLSEAGAVGVAPNLLTILWLIALAVPRETTPT